MQKQFAVIFTIKWWTLSLYVRLFLKWNFFKTHALHTGVRTRKQGIVNWTVAYWLSTDFNRGVFRQGKRERKFVLPPGSMPFISHPHLLCFCPFQSKCLTLMLVTLHSFCVHSESPNAEQESDETIRREDAPRALVFYSVCSSLFFLSKSPDLGLGDKVLNSQVTYAVFLNREWLDAGE